MFAQDKINDGRQMELDIAKGLAILFMINIHVLWLFTDFAIYESAFAALVYFMGGPPAAPVFMVAMGVGVVYSRRDNWQYFFRRGLLIMVIGYLLNLFRFLIPFLIALEFNLIHPGEIEASFEYSNLLMIFMEVDILQFAGLSLLFIALLKKIKLPVVVYPLVAIVFAMLNFFVRDIQVSNTFFNSLLGLFWGSGLNSSFPFFIWIFYPLLGVFFGSFLIRCKSKNKLYLLTAVISLLILFLSAPRAVYLLSDDIFKYYHHDIFGNFMITGFVFFWLSLLYFVGKIIPGIIKNGLKYMSRKITHFYIIHWLLIGWGLLVVGFNSLMVWPSVVAMVSVLIITAVLTYYFNQKYNMKI